MQMIHFRKTRWSGIANRHLRGGQCSKTSIQPSSILAAMMVRSCGAFAFSTSFFHRLLRGTGIAFALIGLLLTGCAGGGGGGGGAGSSSGVEPFRGANLEVIPAGDSFNMTLHNYPSLGDDVASIWIIARTGDDSEERTIRLSDIRRNKGDFVIANLISGQSYSFTFGVIYFGVVYTGDFPSLPINFVREDNHEDHNTSGGILLGSNYDGDYRADMNDPDDDNDGVNDLRADGTVWDLCSARQGGELGWTSNSATDYDGDGCRDDGEDNDDDNDGMRDEDELPGCELNSDCDGDGTRDGIDSCVDVVNYDHTDTDGDGRGDVCDDSDADGLNDAMDIDADGDGLIEIGTAEELNAVRFVLNGTGFKQTEGAILNQTGCGDGGRVTACSGYELVRDISLGDYIAKTNATAGWQPIAHDTNPNNDGVCDGKHFTATFDGNNFKVTDLFINRSTEDCIGLFGRANGKILNLGVVADRIIGRDYIGGLVGWGQSALIVQSYAISGEVRGKRGIGGLAGLGLSARITRSYGMAARVNGNAWIGGLVGYSRGTYVVQSYAISSEVRGYHTLGGLMGHGERASIVQSYAVNGIVQTDNRGLEAGRVNIGGLVGHGGSALIVQSYAISGEVGGNKYVGGLIGWGKSARVTQSYGVSGSVNGATQPGGLVGFGEDATAQDSYWDTQTSGRTNSAGGSGRNTAALRSPTEYNGIYGTWDDGAINKGTTIAGVDHENTIWCDEDHSGVIEEDEKRDDTHADGDNRVWDFGTATDYPAIRCTGDDLDDQRAWWSLSGGNPQLDQTLLDAWLDGSLR